MDEKRRRGPRLKDPRLVKVPSFFKLPRWMVDWLAAQGQSRAVLIETALIAHYGLSPETSPRRAANGGVGRLPDKEVR